MDDEFIIFQEPPSDLDESWRHGALLGGMCSPQGNDEIARAFRRAAEILINRNTKDAEAYEILYPVLYSYRHAVELYLKAILQNVPRKHGLTELAEELTVHVQKTFKQELPEKAKRLILDFAEYDPSSTAFRYGDHRFLPGEYWINLPELRNHMDWLFGGFEKMLIEGKKCE